MYFTHHFAHRETMNRARLWLAQLGFRPHSFLPHKAGMPRITVSVPPTQLAEIGLLINALERSDPDGFPSFWDEARRLPRAAGDAEWAEIPEAASPQSAIIGWHPQDSLSEADPELRRIREAMSH